MPGRVDTCMALTAGDFLMFRMSQRIRLNRQGPAIGGGPNGGVRVTAHAVLVRHSLIVENLARFVGLMTIHTCRENVFFFFPQCTLDDFTMNVLNLRVTHRTRRGDISPRDRGSGIGMGENEVRCMA